jgi:hypothetical protein
MPRLSNDSVHKGSPLVRTHLGEEAGPAFELAGIERGGVLGVQLVQREQGVCIELDHGSITSRQ